MTAPVSRTGATDREVEAAAQAAWTTGLGPANRMPWPEISEHTRNVYRHLAVAAVDAARAAAAPDSGQRELIARRIIARHLRLAASAENVGDWPAYLRLCADGHDAGTSWLDHRQVAALLGEQPGGGK